MNGTIKLYRGANKRTYRPNDIAFFSKFKGDYEFLTDFPARKTRTIIYGSQSDGDRKDLKFAASCSQTKIHTFYHVNGQGVK